MLGLERMDPFLARGSEQNGIAIVLERRLSEGSVLGIVVDDEHLEFDLTLLHPSSIIPQHTPADLWRRGIYLTETPSTAPQIRRCRPVRHRSGIENNTQHSERLDQGAAGLRQ